MPQERRVLEASVERAIDGVEPMDMDEEAAKEKVANEEMTEEEQTVTMGVSHYRAIQ
jgi:hypothetical protein